MKGEIERLMSKVAFLQSQLMDERNKHVKNGKTAITAVRRSSNLMRLGFGFGDRSSVQKTAKEENGTTTSTQETS